MDRSRLPVAAFTAPDGHNRAAVEALTERVVKLVLTQLAAAQQRPPLPAEVGLPDAPAIPEEPASEEQLLQQIQAIINASLNPASPGFSGHMDPMPTTISVLSDYIAAALNNNMLSLEMSPLFSRLETQLLAQLAQRFGLGPRAGGVLASGGSLANLQALAVARNSKLGALQQGLHGLNQKPVLFASEAAHTSIWKAAMLLGLGTQAVISVPTNRNSQMDVEQLRLQIERARQAGQHPFCVVATAGTTTTGNIDPLPAIGQLAREYELWLHVDAAYGGALIFSDQQRHRLNGLEAADSLTFNPQKWLYVAKTCAMALFKDWEALSTAFRIQAPYMRDVEGFINLGELSVQGTRHADVLKLWLSLQHLGRRAYEQLIEQSYELAESAVEHIQQRTFLEAAGATETNIVCFRGTPQWVEPQAWDSWNEKLQAYLLQHANFFVSLPAYRGQRWLRAVLLNPYLTQAHIADMFAAIDAFAAGSDDKVHNL